MLRGGFRSSMTISLEIWLDRIEFWTERGVQIRQLGHIDLSKSRVRSNDPVKNPTIPPLKKQRARFQRRCNSYVDLRRKRYRGHETWSIAYFTHATVVLRTNAERD